MERSMTLTVNGKETTLVTDPSRSLLDVLREELHLTGTKYGCGKSECGACTVMIGDEAVRSCYEDVGDVEGRPITTIEGLSSGPCMLCVSLCQGKLLLYLLFSHQNLLRFSLASSSSIVSEL